MQIVDTVQLQHDLDRHMEQSGVYHAQLLADERCIARGENLSRAGCEQMTSLILQHWLHEPNPNFDRILPAVLDGQIVLIRTGQVSSSQVLGLAFPLETPIKTIIQQTEKFTRDINTLLEAPSDQQSTVADQDLNPRLPNPLTQHTSARYKAIGPGWQSEFRQSPQNDNPPGILSDARQTPDTMDALPQYFGSSTEPIILTPKIFQTEREAGQNGMREIPLSHVLDWEEPSKTPPATETDPPKTRWTIVFP